DVPRNPAGHFTLHFYAAIFWLCNYLRQLAAERDEPFDEFLASHPFLQGYLAEMQRRMPMALSWDAGVDWWQQQIGAWEAKAQCHLPLQMLGAATGSDFARRIGFVLVGLVEEEARIGTLFAELQQPLAARRPTLETLSQIWHANQSGAHVTAAPFQPLMRAGLLVVDNGDAARAEWLLRVPPQLWDAAQGNLSQQPSTNSGSYPPTHFAPLAELVLTDVLLEQLHHLPALIARGQVTAIVLRSTPGSGRLAVMGALARELGRGLTVVEGGAHTPVTEQTLGALCTLTNTWPVFTYQSAPGETVQLPALGGYQGPIGIFIGPEGGVSGAAMHGAVTLTLDKPNLAQRRRLWQRAFAGHAVADSEEICRRFHLPAGYIAQAAAGALANAGLAGRDVVTVEDVRRACRMLNRQQLDTLATYLESQGDWSQLVVGELPGLKMQELEKRCRQRERLLDHLGPAFTGSANRGVRALFNGPSGTGKTLAAKILSGVLGMDLYRVDLAAVVNKYIGETEKNLHQILAHAEELDVILLLDEGDSLLGNRTDIRSSNDRYANLETNFLLQRLENYQGIVFITTNVGDNIDSAFQRRMDVVVNFALPREQERWQIWQIHLPTHHGVTAEYLEAVAVRCPLTGGQIRNAALNATLLALDEQGDAQEQVCVRNHHVAAALRSEYRKAGASLPQLDDQRSNGHRQGMAAFLETWA
ncbi:MAG: AAA family ATPase, partial [Caldilineaceae bacterium]|nr:AAA family ATPase [Caldilineaceae bacterium]